jgi:hypothetical protein
VAGPTVYVVRERTRGVPWRRLVLAFGVLAMVVGAAWNRGPGDLALTADTTGGIPSVGCVTQHIAGTVDVEGVAEVHIRFRIQGEPYTPVQGAWRLSNGTTAPASWFYEGDEDGYDYWASHTSSVEEARAGSGNWIYMRLVLQPGSTGTATYALVKPSPAGTCFTISNVVIERFDKVDGGGVVEPPPNGAGVSASPRSTVTGATAGYCQVETFQGDAYVPCQPNSSASAGGPSSEAVCTGLYTGGNDGHVQRAVKRDGVDCQYYNADVIEYEATRTGGSDWWCRAYGSGNLNQAASGWTWNLDVAGNGVPASAETGATVTISTNGNATELNFDEWGGSGSITCAVTVTLVEAGPSNPAATDSDEDGYSDAAENYAGTDPDDADSFPGSGEGEPTLPPDWGTPSPYAPPDVNVDVDICEDNAGVVACQTGPLPVDICAPDEDIAACAELPIWTDDTDADEAVEGFEGLASHLTGKAPFGYAYQAVDALEDAAANAPGGAGPGGGTYGCFTLPRWTPDGMIDTPACLPLQDFADAAAPFRPVALVLLTILAGVAMLRWAASLSGSG